MAKYCTKCGKKLSDGEACNCSKRSVWESLLASVSNLTAVTKENEGFLERNKRVVPDSICANEGEVPIRQYRLARLRSKIRGQYAEGRLQVTSKRLVFRATGFSTLGKTIVQQEFDVAEISGVEVKKNNRVSILNAFFCILLSLLVSSEMESIFDTMLVKAEFLATFFSIILAAGACGLFLLLKDKQWLKLLAFAAAIGALIGTAGAPISPIDIVFGFELFSATNILIFVLSFGWFFALLRVCLVPDLTFTVKTKSASDVVQIRRRVWGMFFKQPQEYIGFSEVLPWEDTDKAAEELGALINDLQTLGELAIDTWKEE